MQSTVERAGLVLIVAVFAPVIAQSNRSVITLERTTCFGACPAYVLEIDSSGAVSFRQGPPSNRSEELTASITTGQFQELVAGFMAIHFFDLKDLYEATATDGPATHIGLRLDGKTKQVTHYDFAPPGLEEIERKMDRAANVHRWLHGDPRSFTLQSPVAGGYMGGGEDLKNESFVRQDVFAGIKPGMNAAMQAAGLGKVPELRGALRQGEDVNAADETGWTALMVAAVTAQLQAVSAILNAGARVDQWDRHGDTALIGAAAVRFADLRMAAEIIGILLAHGAAVDATNDQGESALMWAARSGNPGSIKILLVAGAKRMRADQSGHDALFYLRDARDAMTFDPATVERYDRAESVLEQR